MVMIGSSWSPTNPRTKLHPADSPLSETQISQVVTAISANLTALKEVQTELQTKLTAVLSENIKIKLRLLQIRLDRVYDTRIVKQKELPPLEDALRKVRALEANATDKGAYHHQLRAVEKDIEDVKAIQTAQTIIEKRVTEDMRRLAHPGYTEESQHRISQATFVHKELEDTFDPLIPTLRKLNCSFNHNENGIWAWREGYNTERLVVLGTDRPDQKTMDTLLGLGYAVWERRVDRCYDSRCREGISYMTYLSDVSSPAKPTADTTLFVHGHLLSWHSPLPLGELLDDGVACQKKIGRYVPLDWWSQSHAHNNWGNINGRFARDYNMAVGGLGPTKGNKLLHFCCGQFAVSRELIERNSIALYTELHEARLEQKFTDYAMEFYWHLLFGEEEVTDPFYGIPKECQHPENISLPVTQYSRLGQWTNKERAEVTVVLGFREAADEAAMRYVAEVRAVFPAEVNIWVRNHAYACSEKEWRHEQHCDYHRGYLLFTNDQDRPDSDAYIFLKGKEVPTADFAQHALRRAKCATAAARYTPLHDTRHAQNSLEAKTTFLVGARDHGTKDFGLHRMDALQAYNGSEFVVPKATLANASFPLLQATYEHYILEFRGREDTHWELDYYWHYFFGQNLTMAEMTCPN